MPWKLDMLVIMEIINTHKTALCWH